MNLEEAFNVALFELGIIVAIALLTIQVPHQRINLGQPKTAGHSDYLCCTDPLEKAGHFLLQFFRVGGELICTFSNLNYAACSRFGSLLNRLHLQGNTSDILGANLDTLGNVCRRLALFVDR
jgi:hypothetical protein